MPTTQRFEDLNDIAVRIRYDDGVPSEMIDANGATFPLPLMMKNPTTGKIVWTAAEFAAITPEEGKFYMVGN